MLSALLLLCIGAPLLNGIIAEEVQIPLVAGNKASIATAQTASHSAPRQLRGRFLQITDIHPDPFYKLGSSTDVDGACHRGEGSAGYYGAEKSECDAPFSLVNATFRWIEENLKDTIDFVVWTGDSARHDNDEQYPRTDGQVLRLNKLLIDKFDEVFGQRDIRNREQNRFQVPIIPTFGNNDVLPHNIFTKGPNAWTKRYAQMWRDIIPEEQRHSFDRGGWFYVEVIPNKLAIFSLNTLYFFESNSAVDGCASRRDPGFEQMEWLRIQLAFLRQRGMKAILTGHVPPARSREKSLWDETCWQKYAIWMQRYRDVVVGSLFGHMNVEHFVLQDFNDIDYDLAAGYRGSSDIRITGTSDGLIDVGVRVNAPNYINSLRQMWAKLPSVPESLRPHRSTVDEAHQERKEHDGQRDFFNKIGGSFAERFSVAIVVGSVVPNYFPALRVYEYNITGLEHIPRRTGLALGSASLNSDHVTEADELQIVEPESASDSNAPSPAAKKTRFTLPEPPSKHSPPGPAYSPQTFSLIGYTQYFANLTAIHHNHVDLDHESLRNVVHARSRWNEKNVRKVMYNASKLIPDFNFEVGYNTSADGDVYNFKEGLTVRQWVSLAATVGDWTPDMDLEFSDQVQPSDQESDFETDRCLSSDGRTVDGIYRFCNDKVHEDLKKESKKRHLGKARRREIMETWYSFASRSVIGSFSRGELKEKFG